MNTYIIIFDELRLMTNVKSFLKVFFYHFKLLFITQ